MSEKIFDWKGNEVKAGMTIYFVRTKPLSFGKMGWLIPQLDGMVKQILESDEDQFNRENEDVWILGNPYNIIVMSEKGTLRKIEQCGEYTFETPLEQTSMIAIKGISDIKQD